MKTRVSKIARLTYQTREQLNVRLLNGEFGAPLLEWLNELPATKELVAEFFGSKPITKQNLSEWRHGGYEDWLRHQHRQESFHHMNEQGEELQGDEGSGNLFENFSRIVLAEMAEDLNTLHEITDRNERWQRLREISRDLARLQHSYSHSRKTELSRRKWEYETGGNETAEEEPTETPETALPSPEPPPVAPGPTESNQKDVPADDPFRRICHRNCYRDCICKDCHPDDGPYPYAQAVKDYEETNKPGYWDADRIRYPSIINVACDCHCRECVVWEQTRPFLAARASCPGEPHKPETIPTTHS